MVVGVILQVGIPIVGSAIVQSLQPRQRFPAISPEDILRTALASRALAARGLEPRLVPNPFEAGGFLLATRDQRFVEEIALTLAERKFFGLTRAESEELFFIRQRFIDSFPGAGGVPLPVAAPPPVVGPQVVPQVVLGNPEQPAIDRMKSISCTSRATTLEALRRCQEGP